MYRRLYCQHDHDHDQRQFPWRWFREPVNAPPLLSLFLSLVKDFPTGRKKKLYYYYYFYYNILFVLLQYIVVFRKLVSIISSAPRPRPISTTMLSLTSNDTKIKITAEKLVPLVGKRLFVVSFKMFHKAYMSYSQLNPQGFRCPVLKNCAQNNENFTFKKDDISTMLCASNVFRAVSN